jgi:hypothetical protein
MKQYVDLSVTESKLGGAVEIAQDMLFVMCTIKSMGFKVKTPMILYIDKKVRRNWPTTGASADTRDTLWSDSISYES